MKNIYLFIIVFLICSDVLISQVAINTTGDQADASSMLDVKSTEKGMLIPRMSMAQRDLISSPVTGLLIYQTDNTPGFYFYDGSAWVVVGNGATINSLYDGASDGSSVFLGNGSGISDDGTSNQNLGYGISALNANTSGYENTAIGIEALKMLDGGHHNTALGIHSLSAITTGSGNTALGTNTGLSNTGSGNIFIGANAAYNETGSNKLYIHNSASSSPLIYGEFDNTLLRINGTLDINNAYQLPTVAGTNGQLLKTDGSGSLSWADDTNTGANDINGLSDGKTREESIFLGNSAGANDIGSHSHNTGVGNFALYSNTLGDQNSAFGYKALYSNGSSANTAIGYRALYSNTSGMANSSYGLEALYFNTTGSNNTAIGLRALYANETGEYNTAIGQNAGNSVTGSGNIFIGFNAGYFETGSNKLYIENSNSGTPLIYGDFENNIVRINHKLELTSDSTGSSFKLYEPDTAGVHYTMFKTQPQDTNIVYFLPGLAGSAGQVLKYNSVGKLGWDNDNGATNINGLSDAKTDGRSVFLGEGSGNVDDGTNNYNSAVGYKSLYENTTGHNNVAIGNFASYETETGSFNVAIGSQVNGGNTGGSNNTIIGYEAGGDYWPNYSASGCVFLGYKTGYNEKSSNKLYIDNSDTVAPLIYGEFDNDLVRINGDLEITGSTNLNMAIDDLSDAKTDGSSVFLGEDAGVNDDGSDNNSTAVGKNALKSYTTGENNTAVGKHALYYGTTGSNNTAIGADAGQQYGHDFSNTGTFGKYTIAVADNYYRIGNSSVTSIGGQVGWSTYSDKRFKRDVNENVAGLDFILKLRPVSYHWDIKKLDMFMGISEGVESNAQLSQARRQQEAKVYTGFLAQEVEQAAKEIGYNFSGVETPPNDGTPYSLRYAEFVVPLVKAVQEQQEMIESQYKEKEEMQKQINVLLTRLEKLEENNNTKR